MECRRFAVVCTEVVALAVLFSWVFTVLLIGHNDAESLFERRIRPGGPEASTSTIGNTEQGQLQTSEGMDSERQCEGRSNKQTIE